MKKIIYIILIFIFTITFSKNILANTIYDNVKNYSIEYKKNILIWESFEIDITKPKNYLEKKYNIKLALEWNIKWEESISWDKFTKNFDTVWDKTIVLNIYKILEKPEDKSSIKQKEEIKEFLLRKEINIFIYKDIIAIIFEEELWEKIEDFKNKAKDHWTFIYEIWRIWNNKIDKINYIQNILEYENLYNIKSNYISIWWSKDFLFNILSQINSNIKNKKLDIVLISSYNINILNKLLQNLISNKEWINNIILLDELSISQIIKNPNNISLLEKEIKKNNYDYINLNSSSNIHDFLFISKFVNILSNEWFYLLNIYIILLIPFLLILVSIFKHIIWLSPIWILIPISISILFFKIWILATSIILIWFLIVNLLSTKIISKYRLHYTPKIGLFAIINIIFLILLINILYSKNLIDIDNNDIIILILFILIAEKIIILILSKSFREYKRWLLSTFLFWIISFLIFSETTIKTFILAYPESILFLIPISFILWKYTWLRINEYFRFKEIIRSIED